MSDNKKKTPRVLNWLRRGFLGSKKELSIFEEEQIQSPIRTVFQNFFRKKTAVFGLVMFTIILLFVLIGRSFVTLDLSYVDSSQMNIPPGFDMLSVPSELNGNIKRIEAGKSFSIGLSNDGEVFIWGMTGMTNVIDVEKDMPEEVTEAFIVDIAVGSDHVYAIDDQDNWYFWGVDRNKQNRMPDEVEALHYSDIMKFDAGNQVTGVLTNDGYLYIWGNNNLNDIRVRSDYQGRIVDFTFTGYNYLIVLDDGTVAYAGAERENAFTNIPEAIKAVDEGESAEAAGKKKVVSIASTYDVVVAADEDGELYFWGNITNNENIVPEHEGEIIKVSAGKNYFVGLLDNGDVIAWGNNALGQTDVPSSVLSKNIVDVMTGGFFNYAIDDQGNCYTWGLKGYLLGTDEFGRDILTRIIHGGLVTMTVGAVAVAISTVLGVIFGGLAGYFGGVVDLIIMRVAEVIGSLPSLPLLLILSSILGQSFSSEQKMYMIMIILGIIGWTGLCILVRAEVLRAREQEFVTAAKAMGVKESKIVFRHIIPNVISTIIVSATLGFATSMLTESGLAFLGFGIAPPTPTWGNMLNGANNSDVIQNMWWRWVFTSVIFGLTTISINLMGDGLRDAMDPRSTER
ncbi:MAG: ABC transporter permease subunit [Clostridia bacterium]|nr:ABC transporter permease subunit [Clostridia bacterium]